VVHRTPETSTKDRWLVDFFDADPRWHLADGHLTLTAGRRQMRMRPKEVLYRG
jgi:hypothetical protein